MFCLALCTLSFLSLRSIIFHTSLLTCVRCSFLFRLSISSSLPMFFTSQGSRRVATCLIHLPRNRPSNERTNERTRGQRVPFLLFESTRHEKMNRNGPNTMVKCSSEKSSSSHFSQWNEQKNKFVFSFVPSALFLFLFNERKNWSSVWRKQFRRYDLDRKIINLHEFARNRISKWFHARPRAQSK